MLISAISYIVEIETAAREDVMETGSRPTRFHRLLTRRCLFDRSLRHAGPSDIT
jgi:hypothetical protein